MSYDTQAFLFRPQKDNMGKSTIKDGKSKNGYKDGDRIDIAGLIYTYVEDFKRFELKDRSGRGKKLSRFIPGAIFKTGAGTWTCGGLGASTPRAVVLLFARGERVPAKKGLELARREWLQDAICLNELDNFLSETKSKSKK